MENKPESFSARLEIIGINPFVFVPEKILLNLFREAGRDKSPIPVCGTVNGLPYLQTLMKFRGYWRLYINLTTLKVCGFATSMPFTYHFYTYEENNRILWLKLRNEGYL